MRLISSIPRSMIKNSKAWANARGLLTKSDIHGEEEWRLPTHKEFELVNKKGSSCVQNGAMEMEDWGPDIP